MNEIQKLKKAQADIKKLYGKLPKILIVLGSGLGRLPEEMEVEKDIPFKKISYFKEPTVVGHSGRLLIGRLGGIPVSCMQGRLHYYEGHSMQDVVFPLRALALSGAELFILTNAAGGVHSKMKSGDLILIRDHINMMGNSPLMGANLETLGPRFPDLSYLYPPTLRKLALQAAKTVKANLKEGVYLGTHGPSYETPAEVEAYKRMGADVVGMSTVPEAIALGHMKKRILGVSCVTNLAAGVAKSPLEHEEVLENAKRAYAPFARLIIEIVKRVDSLEKS